MGTKPWNSLIPKRGRAWLRGSNSTAVTWKGLSCTLQKEPQCVECDFDIGDPGTWLGDVLLFRGRQASKEWDLWGPGSAHSGHPERTTGFSDQGDCAGSWQTSPHPHPSTLECSHLKVGEERTEEGTEDQGGQVFLPSHLPGTHLLSQHP